MARWRASAVAAAVGLLVWFGAGSASAHSVLLRSDPPSGAVLSSSPAVITLEFDEEITTHLSSARLVDASGHELSGVAVEQQSKGEDLRVSVPPTGSGTYSLLWRVMSADDGHLTDGVVVFTVGTPSGTVTPWASTGGTTAQSVVPRWLLLAGLSMALGAAVMRPVLRRRGRTAVPEAGPDGIPRRATARLYALVLLGAGIALVATCVDLLLRADTVAGAAGVPDALWALAADTTWGRLWLCRALALAAVIVIVAVARRGRRGDEQATRAWVVIGLLALAVATEAGSGHAAALPSGVPQAEAVAVVHALAALTWIGGVVAVLVLMTAGGGVAAAIGHARWRIATLFVGSTTLLAASGLVSAGFEVPVSDGLGSTDYGRALVVKLLAAVPLVAVAAMNANRLHGFGGRPDPGHTPALRRSGLLAEVGFAAIVLVVASVLLDQVPARSVAPAPAPAEEQFASRTVDDLVVSVSGTPGWVGSNGVTVRVVSTRRPAPAPVEGVSLDVRRGGSTEHVRMSPTEPGSWYAVVDLDGTPGLELSPVVTRSGRQWTATFPWSVTMAKPATPSGIALAPWTDGLGVLVLVGGMLGTVLLHRARRRPTEPPAAGPTEGTTEPGPAGHAGDRTTVDTADVVRTEPSRLA